MFHGRALMMICLLIPAMIMAQDISNQPPNFLPHIPNPFTTTSSLDSDDGNQQRFGLFPLAGEIHTRFCNEFCANAGIPKFLIPTNAMCTFLYHCPPATSGETPPSPGAASSSSSENTDGPANTHGASSSSTTRTNLLRN